MNEQESAPEESNKDFLPDSIPIPEQPKQRARSGFARKEYWDEPSKDNPAITNREAKSIWARDAAERGLIGGARPGAGRPRKNKLLAEVVTEKASDKADQIAKELIQMATQHKSPAIKLGAIDRINKFEQDLEKNMRDDEKELRKLSGPSLDEKLAELLQEHNVGYDYDLPSKDVEEIE
jgi:hypothetical protein